MEARGKPTARELTEHVLDGCTRAKQAAVALKRLGCHISSVSVGGKNPKITIEAPGAPMSDLHGETKSQWVGAGGHRMVTYLALFMNCRVEWTQPGEMA